MLWFVLVPIIFVSAFREFVIDGFDNNSILSWFIDSIMCLLVSFLAASFCAGFALLTGLLFDTHEEALADQALVTIRDKDGVQGNWFIGSGSIHGQQYYFYYAQNNDGSVSPNKVNADLSVRVFEEKRQDAHLLTFRRVFTNRWANILALAGASYSYEFHVPTGTIRRGFSM